MMGTRKEPTLQWLLLQMPQRKKKKLSSEKEESAKQVELQISKGMVKLGKNQNRATLCKFPCCTLFLLQILHFVL